MDVPGLNCVIPVTVKVMLMLKRQPCADLIPAAAALTAGDEHGNETVAQHGHLAGDGTEMKLLFSASIWLLLGTK